MPRTGSDNSRCNGERSAVAPISYTDSCGKLLFCSAARRRGQLAALVGVPSAGVRAGAGPCPAGIRLHDHGILRFITFVQFLIRASTDTASRWPLSPNPSHMWKEPGRTNGHGLAHRGHFQGKRIMAIRTTLQPRARSNGRAGAVGLICLFVRKWDRLLTSTAKP